MWCIGCCHFNSFGTGNNKCLQVLHTERWAAPKWLYLRWTEKVTGFYLSFYSECTTNTVLCKLENIKFFFFSYLLSFIVNVHAKLCSTLNLKCMSSFRSDQTAVRPVPGVTRKSWGSKVTFQPNLQLHNKVTHKNLFQWF